MRVKIFTSRISKDGVTERRGQTLRFTLLLLENGLNCKLGE